MPPRRFRFRLQTVLEYKQRREEEEQRELAKKKEILAKEEKRLRSLQRLQETRRQELAEKSAKGDLNVDELRMYHEHQKKMARDIAHQNVRVQQAQADMEFQRQKLLQASKEKKTYEKLKEKHHQAFVAEVEAEEAKLIDEIATTKFDRGGERYF